VPLLFYSIGECERVSVLPAFWGSDSTSSRAAAPLRIFFSRFSAFGVACSAGATPWTWFMERGGHRSCSRELTLLVRTATTACFENRTQQGSSAQLSIRMPLVIRTTSLAWQRSSVYIHMGCLLALHASVVLSLHEHFLGLLLGTLVPDSEPKPALITSECQPIGCECASLCCISS
jgi:hypothetical protein